jgi:hypothetical protein
LFGCPAGLALPAGFLFVESRNEQRNTLPKIAAPLGALADFISDCRPSFIDGTDFQKASEAGRGRSD